VRVSVRVRVRVRVEERRYQKSIKAKLAKRAAKDYGALVRVALGEG
jgi:hypothetical protein